MTRGQLLPKTIETFERVNELVRRYGMVRADALRAVGKSGGWYHVTRRKLERQGEATK